MSSPTVRVADRPRLIDGTPFSFSGFVTLTQGGSLPVNEEALKNNTGKVLEVRELKFGFTIGTPAGAVDATIAVVTEAGENKPITLAPIPVSLLGIRRGMSAENLVNDSAAVLAARGFIGQTVWRLDAPLYLLPGDGLKVTLGHRSLVPNTARAFVTMSGQAISRAPAKRMLPYIAAYVGQQIDYSASTTIPGQSSTEKHLVNALTIPIRVTRFTGRLQSIVWGLFTEAGGWSEPADACEQYVQVTMRSSQGVPNIRFPTPFGRVFEQISSSWECSHILAPGAYYILNFIMSSPGTVNDAQIIPAVAMHAIREDRS